MSDLSIIIPTCNEWPVIAFTVRSVYEEIRDRVDAEIIVVDNFCPEVEAQGHERDRTYEYLMQMAKGWPWLKVIKYEDKLSHWNAKRAGVALSTGRFIQFLDAHVIPSRDSIYNQYRYYAEHHEELNGVLHLPVTYHICEYHKLMYKLVPELDRGFVGYSFTGYPDYARPFIVPCMTTDGIMMTRGLYDYLGGIPEMMGIWGGGENFINFALAILGKNVWMCGGTDMNKTLNHHGDKRGYSYNFDDLCRNRCTAMFMIGGRELAETFINHHKGHPVQLERIYSQVVTDEKNIAQRADLAGKQTTTIQDWCARWV